MERTKGGENRVVSFSFPPLFLPFGKCKVLFFHSSTRGTLETPDFRSLLAGAPFKTNFIKRASPLSRQL